MRKSNTFTVQAEAIPLFPVLGTIAVLLFTLGMGWRVAVRNALSRDAAQRQLAEVRATCERLKSINEVLLRRAHVDALTALPNRMMFEERLRQAVARLQRMAGSPAPGEPARLAVLYIDLDRLGAVNEALGVTAGDHVLREAGRRMRAQVREGDTLARDGGDVFLVLMENVAGPTDCAALAERLIATLAQPFDAGTRAVEISASIGIAIAPDHGEREELVARADQAMRAAKRTGGNGWRVYDQAEGGGSMEQLALINDLRHAAELGQLSLHYQPKVDARRGEIRGVEALLRWTHPERGMIGPAVFIPIAERTGLMPKLGAWVIQEACRQMAEWASLGIHMRVAVNVSAHQLCRDDFVAIVSEALATHRVDPSQLVCEITESLLMEDIDRTRHVFEALGQLGVHLSIDDFGTGYSSLSYLRLLPARQLKIDRSFVKDLELGTDARKIVDAVIRLAHALDLRVVAEGVETAGQRDILTQLDCDELQGFLYARPMTAASLLAWAGGNKPVGAVDFSPSVMAGLSELAQ